MGFLDSLKSMFAGGGGGQSGSEYWVYVKCRRCGEAIKTRIDLHSSLSAEDDGGYVARKTLVGSKLCFERIEVTLYFDGGRKLVNQDIAMGEFITAEEYEALTQ